MQFLIIIAQMEKIILTLLTYPSHTILVVWFSVKTTSYFIETNGLCGATPLERYQFLL